MSGNNDVTWERFEYLYDLLSLLFTLNSSHQDRQSTLSEFEVVFISHTHLVRRSGGMDPNIPPGVILNFSNFSMPS